MVVGDVAAGFVGWPWPARSGSLADKHSGLVQLFRFLTIAFVSLGSGLAAQSANTPATGASVSVAAAATAAGELSREPVPAWVEPVQWTPIADPAAYRGAGSVAIRLDSQARLGPGPAERYRHTVVHLLNGEGVRRHAEISIEIQPEYERLHLHVLRVHRDGAVEDRLAGTEFKPLRRETSIERQLYDGSLTYYAVLSDIRPGDVIEQAYSIVGEHPMVTGRSGATFAVGAFAPIIEQTFLVRQPSSQVARAGWWFPEATQGLPEAIYDPVALAKGFVLEEQGGVRVWRWSGRDLPAVPFEEGVAVSSYPLLPYWRLSGFATWAAVADWAREPFATAPELPAELARQLAGWREKHATPEARVAAAIRWVQDDIRYFAFAMGEQNWRPRPLAEIARTRFGDCKDKSVLLAALLRALGEDAWPALVNTNAGDDIERLVPAPYVFNHAIVAVRRGADWRWIDPTLRLQRGPGAGWRLPDYARALVLAPRQTALTVMKVPVGTEPDTVITDGIALAANGDAVISHRIELRGSEADSMRERLDASPLSEIGLRWAQFVGRFYDNLEERRPLEVTDDPLTGHVTLSGEFLVRGAVAPVPAAEPRGFATVGYGARMVLDPVEVVRRRWPMQTAGVRWVRHDITLSTPFDIELQRLNSGLDRPDVGYEVTAGAGGNVFRARHEWRIRRAKVPAAEVVAYRDTVRQLLRDATLSAIEKKPEAPAAAAPAL